MSLGIHLNKPFIGDWFEFARQLPDESVHCIVTSPPYWGHRDYDLDPTIWDESVDCEHVWAESPVPNTRNMRVRNDADPKRPYTQHNKASQKSGTCVKCGAWLGCLGQEPTPEMFIRHMVQVCAEAWRVLRPDGTMFLNVGDTRVGSSTKDQRGRSLSDPKSYGMKKKDLVGIPSDLAKALREFGWYWIEEIIWAKPNPVPEGTDKRPTKCHEYIFQFNKSGKPLFWTHDSAVDGPVDLTDTDLHGSRVRPRADYRWWELDVNGEEIAGPFEVPPPGDWKEEKIPGTEKKRWRRRNLWRSHPYFWDMDAVRVPHKAVSLQRAEYILNAFGAHPEESRGRLLKGLSGGNPGKKVNLHPGGRHIHSVWEFPDLEAEQIWAFLATKLPPETWEELFKEWYNDSLDHFGTVQWFTNSGVKGKHYASFPPALPEMCIKAGTSERGVCPSCGAPWCRVTKKDGPTSKPMTEGEWEGEADEKGLNKESRTARVRIGLDRKSKDEKNPAYYTLGWRPTCRCEAGKPVPAVVLDMFGEKMGRNYLYCDLNPKYVENVAKKRLEKKHRSLGDENVQGEEQVLWS